MTIELTTGQKLQVAAILLALGLASYLLFANSKTVFDQTVNAWTLQHDFPKDPKAKLDKEKNPIDPQKHQEITVFASADGQVEFIETPNDPDKHLLINFKPDKRQANKVFIYYPDPMLAVGKIKDPVRHALAYAVYLKLFEPSLAAKQGGSVLAQMQPSLTNDREQLDAEGKARATMDAAIAATDAMVVGGVFHPELLDPMAKALKVFQGNSNNIMEDAAKQDQARKLLTMASTYQKKIYEEKGAAIDRYIDEMEKTLHDDQKDSLVAIVAKREQKAAAAATAPGTGRRGSAVRGGTRGTTPPARGNRGPALTSPARGRVAAPAPAAGR